MTTPRRTWSKKTFSIAAHWRVPAAAISALAATAAISVLRQQQQQF